MDVVSRIRKFNAGRDPERLQLKYRKMRGDAFTFLRGSCHLFNAQMPAGGVFHSAPPAWACGDLHLENFGSYKGDNRLVYFDINDFDEAALAPASWDMARLLTSLRVGASTLSIGHAQADDLCIALIDAWTASLAEGKAFWIERETAQGLVRTLLDGLLARPRAAFLDARTVVKGGRRHLRIDGKRALPASDAQRTAITTFMSGFASAQADAPGSAKFFRVLDVARRIAGTGSLGVDRHVILVEGKGSPHENYLLDLKRALPSSLAPCVKVPQPRWTSEAQRVVALQRRMQAVSMAFLHPVMIDGEPYVLRALQPSEDRITIDTSSQSVGALHRLAVDMGRLLAWAQLRSCSRDGAAGADALIEFGRSATWKQSLLAASETLAQQVRDDHATFAAAFDDHVFDA